jgi:ABC-type antimicrobial peptide transport system permease subunit
MLNQLKKPPLLAKHLLSFFLNYNYPESILADVEEIYNDIASRKGLLNAKLWYWSQILSAIPPFFKNSIYWSSAMFMNYMKIAMRTIKKQKVYTFINLAGLSMGLACFILISLWARHEMSYDEFHLKEDRLFRTLNKIDNGYFGASVSYALGPELKAKYPDIEESCRVWPWHGSLVKYQDKRFDERRIYLTDPSFFTMFTFPFVKGNPETALADLNSIVITEETALRYFGAEDPMGKVLHVASYKTDFTVTGVVKEIPSNSHLRFGLVARVEYLGEDRIQRWEEWVSHSYVLLREGAIQEEVESKIAGIYKEHLDFEPNFWPVLQPLTKVHLYAYGRPGLVKQVAIFSIIAVFILLIACINFMNLSTARSARRAKEVGLRKVTGAHRFQLVRQFLGESLLLSYMALLLAVVLVQLLLPAFNSFTGKQLGLMSGTGNFLIWLILVIVPLTGLFAGCYPAFHLSAYQPAEVLKGKTGKATGRLPFRSILVVFQFSISIGLIIATLIVSKQLQFIRDKDLGLDRHHVVTAMNNPDLNSRFDVFKSELEREPGVIQVTAAAQRPTDVGQGVPLDWDGREDESRFVAKYTVVDYDFFKTFNMELIEGRSFSKKVVSDFTEACIINESLWKRIGTESILGKQIYFDHAEFEESARLVRVIGVVKDFHSESMRRAIRPFLFRIYRPFHQYVFVRIDPRDIPATLARIKQTFERFAPEYPFGYQFVDEAYAAQYRTDRLLGQLFQVFGAFAIFISCLGLFGLASYTAEVKTKEIGIRKVLGASLSNIILLLSKQFSRWILLANIIAWPIAYFLMSDWLNEFAYHISVGIGIFIISALLAFAVAILTVSYQAIKSALANPVDSLKYE